MAVSQQHTHANLPRLSTSRVICRRDSLSSSRTRDSGYNSDLEALSPLDIPVLGQEVYFGLIPSVPNAVINSLSPTRKNSIKIKTSKKIHVSSITSNPASERITTGRRRPSVVLPDLYETESVHPCAPGLQNDILVHDEGIEKWITENLPSRDRPKERVSSIISLSSTSSSEMYTSTDISDDEHEHSFMPMQLSKSRSTLKVIEIIIRKVEINLRQAAYRQCTNKSTSTHQDATRFSSQQSSRKASQNSGHKRKSHLEGSPPPDDDEDGPHKRRRGSAITMGDDSELGARFACPFYKHDPDQYRNRRTCPGPGWPTVHRMKEHLYRSHAQPIFCPICYATFKSDKEQSNHVRLQQCQRSAPQQIDGIDRETVWTLRKRTTALRLEEDKWRDVYHVLFPDVPDGDIPSPFYDCDSPSESSRRFRRELLRRVQAELFATAEQVPGPMEQQLLQRVAQIVRDCEEDLLRTNTAVVNIPPPDRRGSTTSTLSMLSTASSSGHATPASVQPVRQPTPKCPPPQLPCAPAPVHSDPTFEFPPVIWDDWINGTFSLGIDWDDTFPPGSGAQNSEDAGSFAGFSAPMYT
ncbi:hypothetical protein T440DRAFT_464263 [Plenodomus tracheiphilus IPT5]|uniref:C2H2-type domain-containing protein n=1 Tax=Plenodomus tracheiphilus IPT5 TaxID=1408161 RepID=A0A6A7BHS3_9PLEO|nr:hypothetical protein T440DRAFT_464263 [Plenodomus tracheiphilus IPT5]